MRFTYHRVLEDTELRAHLEQGDTLFFQDLGRAWQDIERQVERLGFGHAFMVSQIEAQGCHAKVAPLGS